MKSCRASRRSNRIGNVNAVPQHAVKIFAVALFAASCLAARAAEPEIVGNAAFSNQVSKALTLLQSRDTNAYSIVTNFVGRIQQGPRSGMWAYRKPPTYEMSDSTAFASLPWCAATIAHDSFHSKLYHDYRKTHKGQVPEEVWTGRAAEMKCMAHQIAVMERIGASKIEIEHARKMSDGSYVKPKETWQDYTNRSW